MKLKKSLRQTLHPLKSIILIVTVISYSFCFAYISFASGPEDTIYPEIYSATKSENGITSFLEESGLAIDLQQSTKILLPNGEGVEVTFIPFSLARIDSSEVETFLQEGDTLGNTIVVSDTCEVIGIIAILLAAACLIFPEPVLCTIATVMQGLFRLLCQ